MATPGYVALHQKNSPTGYFKVREAVSGGVYVVCAYHTGRACWSIRELHAPIVDTEWFDSQEEAETAAIELIRSLRQVQHDLDIAALVSHIRHLDNISWLGVEFSILSDASTSDGARQTRYKIHVADAPAVIVGCGRSLMTLASLVRNHALSARDFQESRLYDIRVLTYDGSSDNG